MKSLSFNSFAVSPNKLRGSSLSPTKKTTSCLKVYCEGGYNKAKLTATSSALSERSPVIETGSLVLSPNGKSQAEAVQELISYGGQSHPLVQMDEGNQVFTEGIGIVRFLSGKRFLITGATGFLAKVLVEKILRTVPEVGKIYLLIKAKDKEVAMARLTNEITNTELFKSLRQTYGESYESFVLSKLVPVVGDVCSSNLGLGEYLADFIAKEVDIIVNSAANTTFDERYDVAIEINTKGAQNLMAFANRCKKLKLFLQVSTAYVNGQRQGKVMEKPFCIGDSIAQESFTAENSSTTFPKLDVQNEINLALKSKEGLDDSVASQRMKELGLQRAKQFGWQDTYVFTKAMGEMVINDMRGDIPVVIIRPSVIESTVKEPFPGWMEGNRMMDPIVLYYGKGQLTGFLVDPNGILDVVPADMVVNATLAAIARHSMAARPDINVYQIATSVVNPLIFKNLAALLYKHYSTSPCVDPKGRPIHVSFMKLCSSMEEFSAHLSCEDATNRHALQQLDSSNERLTQRLEVIYRKAVEQAKHLANIYEPYTFYRGRFDNSNTRRLMESMSVEEKRSFGFDVESIDWKEYITNVHIPGLRRHVMKGRRQ